MLTVYFLLGRWYGDRSLRWLEARSGNALRPVLWIERTFHRARVPVTFVFPGNVSALLAGADGMPVVVYFGVALVSVALRLWAVRALAAVLRGPLLDVVSWIGDHQLWLTVVSIATFTRVPRGSSPWGVAMPQWWPWPGASSLAARIGCVMSVPNDVRSNALTFAARH